MIVAESKQGRHLVGRVDKGADLTASLLEVCAAHGVRAAAIRASGSLEEFDLREVDQRLHVFRAVRRFTTPATLLHLEGTLAEREGRPALEATITVARERDNGTEVLGGILVRARVYAVDFVIDTFDDLLLRRAHDGATGLALLSEAKRIAMPASAGDASARGNAVAPLSNDPAKPVISFEAPARGRVVSTDDEMADAASEPTWAEVVVASAAAVAQADAEPAEDEPMRPGDLLEHFKFGACAVERIEGDGEIVHLRMRNGRLVRLSLDVLEIVYAGVEAGGKNRRYRAVQPR